MSRSSRFGRAISKLFYTSILFENVLQFELYGCQSVLDLGCGGPNNNTWLANMPIPRKTGVDIFAPYIELRKKEGKYTDCIVADIAKVEFKDRSFDAVVSFDVLEHLTKTEGETLLDKANRWARRKVIIYMPNGYLRQGEWDNNIYQTHKSGWSCNDFRARGYRVLGMGGLKCLHKEMGVLKYRPERLWSTIDFLCKPLIYKVPVIAQELLCIKEI